MCVRTYTRKQYEIFYKIQKVKYLPHLLSNHRNFLSESYTSLHLYKFCKRSFDPKSSSYTKCHKRQNDRKGQYTMAHFGKNCKKIKTEVTGTEKLRFWLIYLKTFH